MTKAEKNYRRDYGHKDSEKLTLNYSRDSLKEKLDRVRKIIFEGGQIFRQAELLKMKKSSYVRECAKQAIS